MDQQEQVGQCSNSLDSKKKLENSIAQKIENFFQKSLPILLSRFLYLPLSIPLNLTLKMRDNEGFL